MPHTSRQSGDEPPPAPRARLRPRDAATLIIVDASGAHPKVLMGRRRPDQVFLPDTFVFPGGRVEQTDRAFARHCRLAASESVCVQSHMPGKPSERRAAALALAALRETFEETGVLVGNPPAAASAAPATTWTELLSGGFEPGLESLTYLARAITPPARPRRYDTRFFIVDAGRIAHRTAQSDGELLDIGWFTVEAAKSLKLPSITRHIMDDLAAYLALAPARRRTEPVPFYAHRHGVFERRLLIRP